MARRGGAEVCLGSFAPELKCSFVHKPPSQDDQQTLFHQEMANAIPPDPPATPFPPPVSPHLRPRVPRDHWRHDDLHALVVVEEIVAHDEVEEAAGRASGRGRRSDDTVRDGGVRVDLFRSGGQERNAGVRAG